MSVHLPPPASPPGPARPPGNDHGSVIIYPLPRRIRRGRGVVSAVGLVVIAVLALVGCTSAVGDTGAPDKGYISGDGSVTVTPADKRGAPTSFNGPTLDGAPFDVAAHRGDVVVVNFWASWCPPCIREAPGLQQVWQDYRSRGVQFVGVDVGDNKAAAQAHERRFDVTYPSIEDNAGRILLDFRGTLTPSSRPSTLILDRQGRVAARVLGRVDATTLSDLVADALAEPKS
jgi:thiol-disulfide isomerase/thioredoxin